MPYRLAHSAERAAAITPSDTVNFSLGPCRGIFVGDGGDVTAVVAGSAVLFKAVPTGSILPICATRVNAAGTNATDMVALY